MTMDVKGTNVTAEGKFRLSGSTHSYYYTKATDPTWQIGRRWDEAVISLTPAEFISLAKEDGMQSVEHRISK